jgi:hypothetical protein
MPICQFDKSDNGKNFDGFASGEVYLSFAAAPTADRAAIGIVSIAGQFFNSTVKQDRIGPNLQVLGDFSDADYGDTVVIPAAIAFDFISGVKSVTVTVTSPSNEVLLNNYDIADSTTITVNEYGKYKIKYTATDGVGKTKEKNYTIVVLDTIPPEITLLGELPPTAKVGKLVKIPSMQVTDNNGSPESVKTYIYVIAPNGETTWIKDNQFTPTLQGDYLVVYVAIDSDNATTTKRITVRVR